MSNVNGASSSLRFLIKVARGVDLPTGLELPQVTAESGLLPGERGRYPGDLAAASAEPIADTREGGAVSIPGERPGRVLAGEPSLPRPGAVSPVVVSVPPLDDHSSHAPAMAGEDHGEFRPAREGAREAVWQEEAAAPEHQRIPAPSSPPTATEPAPGESAPRRTHEAPIEAPPVGNRGLGERGEWRRFHAADFQQAKPLLREEAARPLFSGPAATSRGGSASPRAAGSADATQPLGSADRIREEPALSRGSRAGGEHGAITPSSPPEQGSLERPLERTAQPASGAKEPPRPTPRRVDRVALPPESGSLLMPGMKPSPPPLRIRRALAPTEARHEPGAQGMQAYRPGSVKIGRINIQLARGKQPEPEAWPEPPAYADHVLRDEWEWSCHYLR